MSTAKKLTGLVLAAAAATAFAGAPATASAADEGKEGKVHCTGVNACKGKSDCMTASNSCKGMNSCKGKGMVIMDSAKACTEKGGKIAK